MVKIDEPDEVLIDKAIQSLRLTLALINADPVARGAKDMIEAWHGDDLESELVEWLKDPQEKRWLRDRFMMKLSEVWED